MCGGTVHKENLYAVFDSNKLGTSALPKKVCGQCFTLVKILDILTEIRDGRSGQLGIQKPDGDDF